MAVDQVVLNGRSGDEFTVGGVSESGAPTAEGSTGAPLEDNEIQPQDCREGCHLRPLSHCRGNKTSPKRPPSTTSPPLSPVSRALSARGQLDHLDVVSVGHWGDTRLNRILVDYLLCLSYYDSAIKLAQISGIQDLVDIDVFIDAKKVIDALQNKEVGPALAWCAENKSRLKKSKENFRKLALPLPFSEQHHSKLIHYITKKLMDTENPPLVLLNGYAYSAKILKVTLSRSMDGLKKSH
ncbi:hypothetical protein QJS04_geneDACA022511 [Acorus gramineus]|uniref:CTLH/CRA C-terminal to LisH motif domain-containing protein n=1 Tax=Acorus gramineus TaxID=55184 RepID=A0AAV9A819_ACOGR|nr:hypothetical protein QJS04_geneDACA022511 [Acorus gramineus]